jgi:hypothetical protein
MGKLLVWSTRADHVGFRTLDPNDPEESRLTINGVPYRIRLDFHTTDYFGEDKTSSYKRPWHEWDGWGIAFGSVHLSRTDKQMVYGHEHTPAALSKVLDVLAPELVEIIKTDQVQDILFEGALVNAEREFEDAKAELRQAEANAVAAAERRSEADRNLTRLRVEREARSRLP